MQCWSIRFDGGNKLECKVEKGQKDTLRIKNSVCLQRYKQKNNCTIKYKCNSDV